MVASSRAPIDDYYEYARSILTLGDAAQLDANVVLGRLLLLGLVSAVEQYFRSVAVRILAFCPRARRTAADQTLPFGSLDYYDSAELAFGILEGHSLAGKQEIRGRLAKVLGVNVGEGTPEAAALDEFEKVCALRHACVHSRGELSAGNARTLSLARGSGQRYALHVRLAELHQAAECCQNVVRAFNRFMFAEMLRHWAAQQYLTGTWAADKGLFSALAQTFVSQEDALVPRRPYSLYLKYRPELVKAISRKVAGHHKQ